jgi:hypothetical protein
MFKLIWPQANYCECIAFIANESNDAGIFSEQNAGIALRKLGYTMKVTSTVAYQAFTQRNPDRRQLYWTQPCPVGIHGIPWRQLIDADEFGLHLNGANRKYGSSPHGLQIRKPGNYKRGKFKLTIILALDTRDPEIAEGDIGLVSKRVPRRGPVAHCESKIGGWKWDNWICPWFSWIFACASGTLSSLLNQSQLKMELVHVYKACYAIKFLSPS